VSVGLPSSLLIPLSAAFIEMQEDDLAHEDFVRLIVDDELEVRTAWGPMGPVHWSARCVAGSSDAREQGLLCMRRATNTVCP
jgi:hypothetical protein